MTTMTTEQFDALTPAEMIFGFNGALHFFRHPMHNIRVSQNIRVRPEVRYTGVDIGGNIRFSNVLTVYPPQVTSVAFSTGQTDRVFSSNHEPVIIDKPKELPAFSSYDFLNWARLNNLPLEGYFEASLPEPTRIHRLLGNSEVKLIKPVKTLTLSSSAFVHSSASPDRMRNLGPCFTTSYVYIDKISLASHGVFFGGLNMRERGLIDPVKGVQRAIGRRRGVVLSAKKEPLKTSDKIRQLLRENYHPQHIQLLPVLEIKRLEQPFVDVANKYQDARRNNSPRDALISTAIDKIRDICVRNNLGLPRQ